MAPRLPPEITDRIIDYFHDSKADLRTCALVCRGWLASSRFHLFYSITTNPGSYYCYRLYRVIQSSPDIALHVRELRYSHESHELQEKPRHIDIVPDLLKSFSALHKLKICELSWTVLTPAIRESICGILALPSLIHFELDSVHFSRMEHFAGLVRPHLKKLDVSSSLWPFIFPGGNGDDTITQVCLPVDRDEREPCRLEHLSISVSAETARLIDWLPGPQTIIDISNLRSFHCEIGKANFQDALKLSKLSQSSLECLSLCMPHLFSLSQFPCIDVASAGYSFDVANVIGLGCYPNLRVLSLQIDLQVDTATYLTFILSSVTAPHLRQISVRLWLYEILHVKNMTWTDWMGVDCILNSEKFGALCSVKILLEMIRFSTKNKNLLHRKFIDHFPLLASRGLLHITTINRAWVLY
jgi:hypothetical protein